MRQERKTQKVFDGYLLTLLPAEPDGNALKFIRETELDPTACRKHFAWPKASVIEVDLEWGRIFRVTAIGIPKAPEAEGITGSPTLETALQKKLLDDIKDLKGKAAALRHVEHPGSVSDQ